MGRVVIIGGGVPGALSALAARRAGADVTLLGDVLAGSERTTGVFDFGHAAHGKNARFSCVEAARVIAKANAAHPYAVLGARREVAVRTTHELIVRELDVIGVKGPGVDAQDALLLATARGTIEPVALAQESLARGDLRGVSFDARLGVVSVAGLTAMDGGAIAQGLAQAGRVAVVLPVKLRGFAGGTLEELAAFIDDGGRETLVEAVLAAARAEKCPYVLLPTAGSLDPSGICDELFALGLTQAAELVADAPSVPGRRLAEALVDRLARAGVARKAAGALALEQENRLISKIDGERVDALVRLDGDGEGARADVFLRPLADGDALAAENLFVAAGALAGADPEGGAVGLGVAAVTAVAAGECAALFADGSTRPLAKLG